MAKLQADHQIQGHDLPADEIPVTMGQAPP
jgi:hypothetical protein